MKDHVKILGILNIVWGGLICLFGLALFLFLTGVGIAGSTLADHGDGQWGSGDLGPAHLLGLIGAVIGVLMVALGIPGVIAGWGLMNFRPWARILVIILSILHLPSIPLGTAIGVYGLWVLFNDDTKRLFGVAVPVGYAPPPVPMG
jgi:hypothetical protein